MSMDEEGEDATREFMEALVPGFLTGYVIFATFVDEDGETCYWGDTLQGQTAIQSLGMAEAMITIEKARIVNHHFGGGNA